MKKEDIFPGMKVRISNDLTITDRRCSANNSMMRMRNKIYEVKNIASTTAQIYDVRGSSWAFAIEDLLPAPLPYQELKTNDLATGKPELFNPEQLIL